MSMKGNVNVCHYTRYNNNHISWQNRLVNTFWNKLSSETIFNHLCHWLALCINTAINCFHRRYFWTIKKGFQIWFTCNSSQSKSYVCTTLVNSAIIQIMILLRAMLKVFQRRNRLVHLLKTYLRILKWSDQCL